MPLNFTSPVDSACPAFLAEPAEVEAGELPHAVKAQAAGHHRIALEVAREEPEIRRDVEFGAQMKPLSNARRRFPRCR
jgi:hypothetical protein